MTRPRHRPAAAEREAARLAALAMRAAIADRSAIGKPVTAHLDCGRPRRGVWITTWPNLPGLSRVNGRFRHECLPGWEYRRDEVRTELIPDLEALAERGERPTIATSGSGVR